MPRRNGKLELKIPAFEWKQIGGDMNPGAHGGLIAEADGSHIELIQIQPVREYVGDGEAKDVGHPFWSKEAWFDLDDLDPDGRNAKQVRDALKSVDIRVEDGELITGQGDLIEGHGEHTAPEVRALVIAEALVGWGRGDEGPAGWAEDVIGSRKVKWWGSTEPEGWEYLADEDKEFKRDVLGQNYELYVAGEATEDFYETEEDAIESGRALATERKDTVTVVDTFDDEVVWSSDEDEGEERAENRRREKNSHGSRMGSRRVVDPISRAGTPTGRFPGVEEGDFFIEYWPGHPTSIYRAEKARGQLAPRLVRLDFSRSQAETVGSIGQTIGGVAADNGQHAGVVYEIIDDGADVRQIGNVEVTRHGGKVTWTRSKNSRIKRVPRKKEILAPLEPDARLRWETKYEIGDPGAVYEFNVKFGAPGAKFSDDDLQFERDHAVKVFEDILRGDYPWVGNVYLTGRSGGWLAVEDKKGGATEDAVLAILERVEDARDEFVKYMKEEYG
jgi:hypothetical protein